MFFDFTLAQSEMYEFYRLDAKEEDSYQNAQIHYTYLLYPLKSGEITVNFKLIQKVTTRENVAYSFSGDRDNVKGITTVDTPVKVDPLKLRVKPLPEGTQLVGDFTLAHTFKTTEAKAHEPIPFTVEIKGDGYPPLLEETFVSTDTYTLFRENPQVKSIRSTKGTHNTVTYPLALSAAQDFTFDKIVIPVYNPKTRQSYTLALPEKKFTITSVKMSELVDKIDSPAPLKETDWSWFGALFGYLVVFFAGFLTAKSVQWHRKERIREGPFAQKIAKTNDPRTLLALIIAEDSKKYAKAIEKLEAHIYRGNPLNLNEIRKEINA